MKRRFIFFPDNSMSGGSKKVTGKAGIPRADVDLFVVSEQVATKWAANPQIALVYMTQSEYQQAVNDFNDAITDKAEIKSQRSSITRNLNNINKKINVGVKWILAEIKTKFRDDATAQHARYGIEKVNDAWMLPRDNDSRLKALKLMRKAIINDGFNDHDYGKAFWTDIISDFETAATAARDNDAAVSRLVASKNAAKQKILKVHKSLRLVLEGNYPDSYRQVWREWGWQKEKY